MSTASTHQRFLPATLLCALLLAACDSGPTEPVAFQIAIYAGDNQIALVDSMLPDALSVRVTDSEGRPVPEVAVRWIVEEGGGSISAATPSSITNDWGVAYAVYTLGPEDGIQKVTATLEDSPGAPQVTFTARAVSALVHASSFCEDYYGYNCDGAEWDWSPSEVVVPTGKTVAWIWSSSEHNVTFEDDPTEPISAPTQNPGRHIRTFAEPGTYRYRCTLHSTSFTEGMVGTVTVQ